MRSIQLLTVASVSLSLLACQQPTTTTTATSPSTTQPPPPQGGGNTTHSATQNQRTDATTVAPSNNPADGGSTHSETTSTANTQLTARITGQGAVPPIHEVVATVRPDTWNGTGTVTLAVPNDHGEVTGRVEFTGFTLQVRGYRYQDHIRGSLDELIASPTAETAENMFRGTIDLEIHDRNLQGSWEASSQAGLKRRRGNITAQ